MKYKKYLYLILILVVGQYSTLAQQNPVYKLPPYEKIVLRNGLTVYLMEQHEVPTINLSAVIPAGAIYDKQLSGLASLTASALMNGTKSFSKTQLEEELDFLGANVTTYATKEYAGLNARFASKDHEKVLNIIREVLISPTFDEKEFGKTKQLLLASLDQAKDRPTSVINQYFDQFFYGNHVYAMPEQGQSSTVASIGITDVGSFYKSNYRPNGSAIAVVGDFNVKEMAARLTSTFEGWNKGTAPNDVASQSVPPVTTPRVLLVNKDDAKETTFIIGGPGVPRSNPDHVPIEVINTIFGSRFTSWLNDELRVNTGLTYGARSRFVGLKNAGSFSIFTFTELKNTEAAVDKTLEVLNKLHTTGIDEKTLISGKNYVKGGFPRRYETSGQLAGLLTSMFWYGYDESLINNFQNNVDKLTVEKAKSVVTKYFPSNNLQFVFIGRAEDIRKLVSKYGKVTEVQIKEERVKGF